MDDIFRIDATKIQYHPKRVSQWLEGKDDWETAKELYPLYVEIAPIGACNHRCTFCAVDYIGYKAIQLDSGILIDRIREMGSLGVKSVMLAGEGEPLLHKKINRIVSETAKQVDIAFTTNGVLLNKLDPIDLCSWIKVSINAGTKETYAKVHRTKPEDFDTVIENIRQAVKRKGHCTIGMQMVLLPENQNEVNEIQAIGEDLGVDYVVIKPYSQHKYSVTREYENFKPEVPEAVGKLVVRADSLKVEKIAYDKCQATPYWWAYVMASGEVYSCSAYLLDPRFRLGNIKIDTFKEIWQSVRRRENWRFVREELDIHECRLNCRMDKSNVFLDQLVNGIPHVNFV